MAEENNIGASRLLGTNGLQQAVDSLTTQVNKMSGDINKLVSSIDGMTSAQNRSYGMSSSSGQWNAGSNNARYGTNGGGARFTNTGSFRGGGSNNGGSSAGGGMFGGGKLSMGIGMALAAGSALVNYTNKNMSTNMLMDYTATQAMANGGWGAGGQGAARQLAQRMFFANQYGGLSAQDLAQGAAINQYTFGTAQFGGVANPNYVRGAAQVGSFAYANPTMGYTAAATAAQQTFAPRSIMMGQALGLNIRPGASMSDIAQQIYSRTFGNQQITSKGFSAATMQGGSLNVNLQYLGQQLGWSAATQQEYQGIIQGQVQASQHGMSTTQYYKLLQQAQGGDKGAQAQLSKATGLGTSMFETQRNLNATRLTRQEDILESLAPAFDKATNAVNAFSGALTQLLQATGLDKVIGIGGGGLTPFSNAASGLMNTLGIGGGLLGGLSLLNKGGGFGFLSQLMNKGGNPGVNLGNFSRGAYNVTTVAGDTASAAGTGTALGVGAVALPVAAGAGAFVLGADWLNNRALSNQYGVSIPKNYTQKDFDAYSAAKETAMTQARGTWRFRAAQWEQSYFKMNPAGTGGKAGAPPLISYGRSGGGSSSVVGGSPGNGASNMGASAAEIIGFAKKELGVPYGWGQETPGKAFDCSGLIQWAYGQAGVKIPRVAIDQRNAAPMSVPVNQTQPGDLLFMGKDAHHVVMNIGGGQIIEAPHTGADVRIRPLNPSEYTDARRYVNAVGNMNMLNGQQTTPVTLNNMPGAGGDIGSLGGVSELEAVMSSLGGFIGAVSPNQGASSTSVTSGSSAVNGSAGNGNGKNDISSLQSYAKQLLNQYGWSGQWNSLLQIVNHESGWNVSATNPSSGAYGIPQSLPGTKMAAAGTDWKTNGDTQLRWMMSYIKDRYGTPDNAWSHWQRNKSYAVGAWDIGQDQTANIHKGEMIIPAQQAETIRQVLLNNSFNPNLRKAAGINGGNQNNIDINVSVNMPNGYTGTPAEAQTTGKLIVKAIAEDTRIKNLQIGQ